MQLLHVFFTLIWNLQHVNQSKQQNFCFQKSWRRGEGAKKKKKLEDSKDVIGKQSRAHQQFK